MKVVHLTRKGWFGFCPVYMSNPDTESPYVVPRIPYTDWALPVMAYMFCFMAWVGCIEDWGFPIRITGEVQDKWLSVDE